jgi:hypothetical protein
MNEFLLLALIIAYLVITYVPISEAPKGNRQSRRKDPSSPVLPNQREDAENRYVGKQQFS